MADQIVLLKKVYSRCVDLIIKILEDIPAEQLNWKPGGESRSIAGISRHILRVDNMLLKKINIPPGVEDQGINEAELIINKFNEQREYIFSVIGRGGNIEEMKRTITKEGMSEVSLYSTITHIIHHHLYHYAQITYLRRVNDRNWETPLKHWEAVVDLLAKL